MTQPKPKPIEREGFEKFKHDTIMWSTFFAPPTVLFIIWYFFTLDILKSMAGTGVCLVGGIIILAYLYSTGRLNVGK